MDEDRTNLRDRRDRRPARSDEDFGVMSSDRLKADLKGYRTIVLGSTSGIGRAVALALAEAGADVIVHGRSSHRCGRGGRRTDVREQGGRVGGADGRPGRSRGRRPAGGGRLVARGAGSMPGFISLAPIRSPARPPSSLSMPSSICSGRWTSSPRFACAATVGRRMVAKDRARS